MKYEKWSLGYWLLKQYIRFVDWIIHDKIILTGEAYIPKNKPILFAPNHQNALSDPMAILLHTKFQPVWLARADIFKPGIITLALRFLKIMPVYRIRDGKDQLAKNEKTFADSIKVLENNCAHWHCSLKQLTRQNAKCCRTKKRFRELFFRPKKKPIATWIYTLFQPEFTTAVTGNLIAPFW